MSDYKRIQEMLYGLPNTQPVYTQMGTTTVDLDEMRAEITRLQAREAKLREALEGFCEALDAPAGYIPAKAWKLLNKAYGKARAALREEGV